MKRKNNIYEQIADADNLRQAYYNAARGKWAKPEVQLYGRYLEANLARLREALLSEEYHFGDYHYFTIYDPKERVICAASFEERVIHHAVMNVCAPHFENHQLPHSYACRKGKGTFAAIETARSHQRKYQWFLKLDVRKYFDSVDHETLKSLMCRMYKDKRLLQLFDRLIDSYHTRPGKGLPIGNLSSQYFANHYLAQADKYLIHTLGVKNYVRYMDDMLLWDNDRRRLQYVKECLDDFLTARLQLTLKPPVLNRSEHGLTALGFRIYPHAMSLNRRSRDRFALKIRTYIGALHTGELDYGSFMRRIWALYGFVGHATYKGFAGKVMREMETG